MYLATPLGPALAQITEQHLLKGRAVCNQLNACLLNVRPCIMMGVIDDEEQAGVALLQPEHADSCRSEMGASL